MNHFDPIVPDSQAESNTIAVLAPYDDSELATVSTSGSNHIEQALSNAQALFDDRKQWLKTHQRISILRKLMSLMSAKAEALALNAAKEGGKPLIDSRIEVARAIEGVELCIHGLMGEHGTEIPMGLNKASENKLAFTSLEPIGVVVAVSAFNHPLNLIVHQVAPAIAVGCPVIVKPATATPISCFTFVNLVLEAGLPQGWCQCLLPENSELATKLVTDSRVDFFSFIGSGKVGWNLRSKLSPGTRCALEHGGAAPVIIDRDADVEALLPKLLKGGFYHAGQVCVSVQRVFAHASNAGELAQQLAQGAEGLVVGDPTQESTEVGPLINKTEVLRIEQWVQDAVDAGATLLCGGKKLSDSLYAPTVLLDPPDDCQVSQQEIFGPVVCIYSYQDIDTAIEQANSVPFAFQASVFSDNINIIMTAYLNLNASAVMVNEHTAFRVDWMPFAGLRESGYGVGGIPHTMKDMQIEKMLVINAN